MNKLFVYGLIFFGAYYMYVGGSGIISNFGNGNAALVLQGITNSELNDIIINHYKNTVLDGATAFTADAIDTTVTDLNDDGKKDVIAIVESGKTCGTGGCIASIFVEDEFGTLVAIPFTYAVKHIEVLDSLTQGMHDLKLNNDEHRRMIWNGSTYVPETI
jgi:hypothetical protein